MELQSSGLVTGNIDLFTKVQWNTMYPREDYKKRSTYALHFLIAYGNDITQYVDTLKQKFPERLTQVDPLNKNWTPLHIAAMKSNVVVVELLLSLTVDKEKLIHAKDKKGWTPLHYAAVSSESLFALFLKHNGNPKIKIPSSLDCNEIQILTGRVTDIRSRTTLFIEDSESKEQILLSNASEALKEKIFGQGFFFTDSPLYPSSKISQIGEDGKYTRLDQLFIPLYEQSKEKPPSLIIGKCQDLCHVSSQSLECRAKDRIPPYSYISEYTGKKEDLLTCLSLVDDFTEKNIHANEYLFADVNALNTGNESRFYNLGFHNSVAVPINVNGIKRTILVSLWDIKPSEPILIDYGTDMRPLTFGTQILLGKERMISFFKKIEIHTLLEKFVNLPSEENTIESFVDNWRIRGSIRYVLDCPTALLYLHFKNIVNASYWHRGLKQGLFIDWQQKNAMVNNYIQVILNTIRKLESLIHRNEQVKATVYDWVLQKVEKMSVIHILKSLDLFNEKYNSKAVYDLASLLVEIDTFIETYDWKIDTENYPFNLERLAENAFLYYSQFPKDTVINEIINFQKTIDSNSEAFKLNELTLKKLINNK